MTTQNIKSYSNNQVNAYNTDYASKTLSTQTNTKALDSGGSDELTSWYEQAYAYYNAVMSGDEAQPADTDWQSFLDQMQWAADQLGMSAPAAWDPMSGTTSQDLSQDSSGGDSQGSTNDFGGVMGAMGSYTYTNATADIGFTPGVDSDIWSNTVNINIPSLAATVTSSAMTDTRLQPPEDVLKVVVHDSATNEDAVYYIHDYQDATVTVNTPSPTQLSDSSGLVISGTYVDPAEAAAEAESTVPEASIEGTAMTDASGNPYTLYDGTGTDVIDFNPTGSGVSGEVTVNDVMGNCNISVHNTDQVAVKYAPDGSDYDSLLTVTHADGSVDEYHLHNAFTCNINGVADYVQFYKSDGTTLCDQQPEVDPNNDQQMVIPDHYADNFSMNGLTSVKNDDVDLSDDPTVEYPSVINNLADQMGLTPEELIDALSKSSNYDFSLDKADADGDGTITKDELQKQLDKANFPPAVPDSDFILFLKNNDSHLASLLDACKTNNSVTFMMAMQQVTAHTVDLLKAAYPDVDVKATHSNPEYWWEANDITFGGQSMEAFNEGFSSTQAAIDAGNMIADALANGTTVDADYYNQNNMGAEDNAKDDRGDVKSDLFANTDE